MHANPSVHCPLRLTLCAAAALGVRLEHGPEFSLNKFLKFKNLKGLGNGLKPTTTPVNGPLKNCMESIRNMCGRSEGRSQ